MYKKNKLILYISLFILIIISICIMCHNPHDSMKKPFFIEVYSENRYEQIDLWKNEEGVYYIFLPSYSQNFESRICLNYEEVWINGTKLKTGMSCETFAIGIEYDIEFLYGKTIQKDKIVFIQSNNISTMYIDTESGSMEYVHADKENKEKADMSLYTENGKIDYSGKLKSIKGHGNRTWEDFEKKPYNIELSEESNLLNMGSASKWVLLANVYDASNLRNKLVYDFADKIGLKYSPDSMWVDLYLNHEYVGLYLLCEKNEIHNNRIDIDSDNSYLISVEREERLIEQNYPYILTNEKQALRIRSAQISNEKLLNFWQNIEDLIAQLDEDRLFEIIDIESWSKKYLIEEIFGNLDGCLNSQYFYYDAESKLVYAGPVWDYDHAIGNDSDAYWYITNPNTLVVNRKIFHLVDFSWWENLYNNETFYDYMVNVYANEILPAIQQVCDEQLDIYINKIQQASYVNQIRWFGLSESYDLQIQVEKLKKYLTEHVAFLNELWIKKIKYCQVVAINSEGTNLFYSVIPGEGCSEISYLDDINNKTFLGWYYCNTDEPFDPDQPIYEDIEIYAKWKETSSKRMKKIGKLIPLGIIFVLGTTLLITDIRRTKRNG